MGATNCIRPKGEGKILFSVDFWKLKLVKTGDLCPIPSMENCIDALDDAIFYSKLDFNSTEFCE